MDNEERLKKVKVIAELMISSRSNKNFDEMCRTYFLAEEYSKSGDSFLSAQMGFNKTFLKLWFDYDIESGKFVKDSSNAISDNDHEENKSWWKNNSNWGGKGW